MAFVIGDRVQETTATTGTGTLTLAGAVTGFQSFSAIGNGNVTYYTVYDPATGDWEVGIGTYTASGATLSRTTVLSSSNAGSLVPFATGTKYVWCDYPAGKTVIYDDSGNVLLPTGNLSFSGVAQRITGDFSSTSVANRVMFQTSTSNSVTSIGVIPNGTSTQSQISLESDSAVTTGSTAQFANVGGAEVRIVSGIRGAGTYLPMTFYTGGSEKMRINSSGNIGIGTVNDDTAILQIKGGTTTAAALEFLDGTLMTTPDGGSMEFDGNNLSFTNDATSLRGYVPAIQIFRLSSNGSAIGPAINNFFGANSAINLAAGGLYEIEAMCLFTKTTAGTVTFTITSSAAPQLLSGALTTGAVAGGLASGAANLTSLFNVANVTAAFGATGSLTTGANHMALIKLIVLGNASASNLRFNITSSAGTTTPLANSYYKVTKLPAGNSGSFAA